MSQKRRKKRDVSTQRESSEPWRNRQALQAERTGREGRSKNLFLLVNKSYRILVSPFDLKGQITPSLRVESIDFAGEKSRKWSQGKST